MNDVNTAIIILAAGESSRFGSPKALAPWQHSTLLANAITVCRAVNNAKSFIVLGCHADKLQRETGEVEAIVNPQWQQGMGASISCGAQAILAKHAALQTLVILPVDQPFVTAPHLQTLIECANKAQRCAFTRDGDIWGVPAAIPRPYFPQLLALTGDKGLKAVLQGADGVFVDGAEMLEDIDTPQDLARLQAKIANR